MLAWPLTKGYVYVTGKEAVRKLVATEPNPRRRQVALFQSVDQEMGEEVRGFVKKSLKSGTQYRKKMQSFEWKIT